MDTWGKGTYSMKSGFFRFRCEDCLRDLIESKPSLFGKLKWEHCQVPKSAGSTLCRAFPWLDNQPLRPTGAWIIDWVAKVSFTLSRVVCRNQIIFVGKRDWLWDSLCIFQFWAARFQRVVHVSLCQHQYLGSNTNLKISFELACTMWAEVLPPWAACNAPSLSSVELDWVLTEVGSTCEVNVAHCFDVYCHTPFCSQLENFTKNANPRWSIHLCPWKCLSMTPKTTTKIHFPKVECTSHTHSHMFFVQKAQVLAKQP